MKLIVLSTPEFFVEEDQIITALFEEGLDLLHLRKPESEPVLSERLLTLIPSEFHKRIIVHNHLYLKEEFDLKGIHLSRHETEAPHGYRGSVSRTCYSLDDLNDARNGKYEYLFLDPIFDGISEKRDAGYTSEQLIEARRRGIIDRKVMASGGITLENIEQVSDLGFGGAVVCGDLWNRFDVHNGADYKELLNHFRQLRKATN